MDDVSQNFLQFVTRARSPLREFREILLSGDFPGSNDVIYDFLNEIKLDRCKRTLLKLCFEKISMCDDNKGEEFHILLLTGNIENIELFLSIVPNEIYTIRDSQFYPPESLAFLINNYREIFDRQKICYPIGSRLPYVNLESHIISLLMVGYELSESDIREWCDYSGLNYTQSILDRYTYPSESLFEISLRECRRSKINLSQLPLSLNQVMRKKTKHGRYLRCQCSRCRPI